MRAAAAVVAMEAVAAVAVEAATEAAVAAADTEEVLFSVFLSQFLLYRAYKL